MKYLSKLPIFLATISITAQITHADIEQILGEDFLNNSSLDATIRSVYFNAEKSNRVMPGKSYSGAWAGSLAFDFKSGYWRDIIGFDASLYASTKLEMSEKNGINSKQLLGDDREGFGKIGQAFAKVKLGTDENTFDFSIGRQLIYNALISSSTSRSTPSTWQGINFNAQIGTIHIGSVYVNEMALRNQSGFQKLKNFDDETIDYIGGFQIDTTIENVKVLYRNAFARKFLQAHNVQVGYNFTFNPETEVEIDARYFATKKDGDLWSGYTNWSGPVTDGVYRPSEAAFDRNASNISLNAKIIRQEWQYLISVSRTRAESAEGLGRYYCDFGKNTHGIFGIPTEGLAENFTYHDETAWKTGFEYDFAKLGFPGLHAGYSFHYGSGMTGIRGDSAVEQEHDIQVSYTPNKPEFKNLKFKLKYGVYENNEALKNTIGFQKKTDLRMWVDYKIEIM